MINSFEGLEEKKPWRSSNVLSSWTWKTCKLKISSKNQCNLANIQCMHSFKNKTETCMKHLDAYLQHPLYIKCKI